MFAPIGTPVGSNSSYPSGPNSCSGGEEVQCGNEEVIEVVLIGSKNSVFLSLVLLGFSKAL